jgi:uncharacterized protein YdhG (YjbR/CyaY superfamily)
MATAQDYIVFAAERLESCGVVRYKKMFGEYMIYVNQKPIALVCDNTVFVRILPYLDGLLSDKGYPYDGAKEHYILDIENSTLTAKVIALLDGNTPLPKPPKQPKTKVKKIPQSADPIGDYIKAQDTGIQPRLREVYSAIKSALPDAAEKTSYQMPTFYKDGNLIHFAANKKHIGIYPGSEAVVFFADKLTEYKTSKGTIQLPNNKPLPIELIREIAEWSGQASLRRSNRE